MTERKRCIVCGTYGTPTNPLERHHIFYGTANRRLSEKYGCVCYLCREHHTGPHGVHFNKELDKQLKADAQRRFEARYGGREAFMKTFGRNYIDE